MKNKLNISLSQIPLFLVSLVLVLNSCGETPKKNTEKNTETAVYPSDVIPFMSEFKILLGDGTHSKEVMKYQKDNFFYVENDKGTDWVVYKTPNKGITSRTSSNTRTELGQVKHWTPETGGKLTGTLKVQHVSTYGNANISDSYSVVVGQIHSDEGHENEPLKIYYKKFPGHTKGSVFWNYEINTKGDNAKRWDYSTAVWGHDFSVIGLDSISYPKEPKNGIALGEEFSYEVNVYKGMMHLTFTSEGHETVQFSKNLLQSEFATYETIPQQILTLYADRGRDGTERKNAYAGEMQYFKQGAYNQTKAQAPEVNTDSSTKTVDEIAKQYANGCYTEVWFKEATVGGGTLPMEE